MDKLLDKLTFTKDKASLPYRLLKPDGYDKDSKERFPLVVFLHGIGERGSDNSKQLKNGVEAFVIEALCNEYRIDIDRIYLTGVSQGGYGTWDRISRKSELFAAAIPVCGGGDPAQAEKLAKLPIWAFHGDKDPLVPVGRSRDMVAAVKKAGGRPVYTEYGGAATSRGPQRTGTTRC